MKINNRFCFITNDVETTSILHHELRDETGKFVLEQGMPRLLDLYDEFEIKTTFFYTGYIAELYPEVVKMAHSRGHEIASHGYSHKVENAFDVLSEIKIREHLIRSKNTLEQIIGEEVLTFRAPALRVKKNISSALLETGFLIDSSVASQRIDMFLSFGVKHKLNWFRAPRGIYFTKPEDLFSKGNSDLLEIPVSSVLLPYIGTFMRISPMIISAVRSSLNFESKITGRHINFLTHPNEFIDESPIDSLTTKRRSKNYLSYLLGDLLRHRLKLKNLGSPAIPLLKKELNYLSRKEYNFKRCKDVYSLYKTRQ
jgi:hypothetical protein